MSQTPEFPPKYSKIEALTPGRNASVYRAFNEYLNQDVFLKIYEIPDDEPVAALAEPHLLTELEHENLVRVRYVDLLSPSDDKSIRQRLLIAMDLADGGSFQDRIQGSAEANILPSVHESIDLVIGVCNGLAQMHDKDVIHCDIKPANLVLHAGTPKVTDLGLARRLNAVGRAHGSKHARIYRPPEVWQGKGYSLRSDIYQVGIVLYELLGGRISFDSLSAMDDPTLEAHTASGKIVQLRTLGPHIHRRLREIIQKATGEESERYGTMRELIIDLLDVKSKQRDFSVALNPTGFEVQGSKNSTRARILMAERTGKNGWKVKIVDRKNDDTTRCYRASKTIRHPDLSKCRAFLDLLEDTF